MKENLQCDGLNLVQNNGEIAGQTVMHFHLHMIPRYKKDGQKIEWVPGEISQEELEAVRQQIIQ
jgi:histidine triad (HIT) family protein